MTDPMNLTLRYLTFFAAFLPAFFFGQNSLTDEEVTAYIGMFNNAEGTYQIQIIDSREMPSIPLSIIDEIDAVRKENDIAYISVKDNIRIKVLPLFVINAADFVEVETMVYLKSSEI